MNTEIIDAPSKTAVAEYAPLYSQLAELEKKNSTLVFNYEDKKGNKEARSHVNTLRLTKGALERTRKEAKAESLRIGRAVDSEAADIGVRIEAMIAVHQVKIDEIEQRETDRLAALNSKLLAISEYGDKALASEEMQYSIATLEQLAIDDSWQEFTADAAKLKDARLAELRIQLGGLIKAESEARELERLRKEAAARAQKDRDDAIAAEAVRKAEEAAKERAEAESKKAAQAVADAEAKAKKEREDSERRELQLKLDAETSERRRVEAEQKATQDIKDAEAKAEWDRIKAVQDERDRAAAVLQAEADATRRREANKSHLRKINTAALDAFVVGGMTAECAKLAVTLIAQGKIPAVAISY